MTAVLVQLGRQNEHPGLEEAIPNVAQRLSTTTRSVHHATLGASPARTLVHVTLPLAAPGTIAAATLAFLVSFDETVVSLFLVGPCLVTPPIALFRYAESRADPLVAALVVVLIVLTLLAVTVVDRLTGFTRTVART